MQTLTYYYVVRNFPGIAQPGSTVRAYPAGTTNGSGITVADQFDGTYKIVMDHTVNEQCIAKFYDIYLNGVKRHDDQLLGFWVWHVRNKRIRREGTIDFNSLIDEDGNALPTTINNALVRVDCLVAHRQIVVKNITPTSFDVELFGESGDDDAYVDITITLQK